MTTITKTYYRSQYNYAKRDLEKHLEMFDLNQSQRQKLRELIDRMVELQRQELIAPEETE